MDDNSKLWERIDEEKSETEQAAKKGTPFTTLTFEGQPVTVSWTPDISADGVITEDSPTFNVWGFLIQFKLKQPQAGRVETFGGIKCVGALEGREKEQRKLMKVALDAKLLLPSIQIEVMYKLKNASDVSKSLGWPNLVPVKALTRGFEMKLTVSAIRAKYQ